jgi:hypothetical protein
VRLLTKTPLSGCARCSAGSAGRVGPTTSIRGHPAAGRQTATRYAGPIPPSKTPDVESSVSSPGLWTTAGLGVRGRVIVRPRRDFPRRPRRGRRHVVPGPVSRLRRRRTTAGERRRRRHRQRSAACGLRRRRPVHRMWTTVWTKPRPTRRPTGRQRSPRGRNGSHRAVDTCGGTAT